MEEIAITQKEAKERMWDDLIRSITWLKIDCETCPYEKDCEQNNPDFNANYCKL